MRGEQDDDARFHTDIRNSSKVRHRGRYDSAGIDGSAGGSKPRLKLLDNFHAPLYNFPCPPRLRPPFGGFFVCIL